MSEKLINNRKIKNSTVELERYGYSKTEAPLIE